MSQTSVSQVCVAGLLVPELQISTHSTLITPWCYVMKCFSRKNSLAHNSTWTSSSHEHWKKTGSQNMLFEAAVQTFLFLPHLLTWKQRHLWVVLQPATRGCFCFRSELFLCVLVFSEDLPSLKQRPTAEWLHNHLAAASEPSVCVCVCHLLLVSDWTVSHTHSHAPSDVM